MTNTPNQYNHIKEYFQQLVGLEKMQRQQHLASLVKQGKINNEQLALLKSMLDADEYTDFATNIQEISPEFIPKSATESPSNYINQQIGVYLILKPLGHGGMGDVYLAQRNDGEFEQHVAIKIPHSHFNPHMIARFENERQILAQLSHENIARLLDGGTSRSKQPYLVMEYIQGLTIDNYCCKKIPNLAQRLHLILQVCAAVTFSHQQFILHRDLKPSNILVTEEGVVKLLDFGIAKLFDLDDEIQANNTATQIMTRYYASPEQLQGKPASTHSDLFSLAIIAYELITGYHPFLHQNQHEREQNLVSGKIMRVTQRKTKAGAVFPKLAQIPSGKIQGDLENILLKALSVNPAKRYTSVKEFADDLNNFLSNKPILARKPNMMYITSKWMQRHKAVSLLTFITFMTLLLATFYSINKANIAIRQKKIAQIETNKAKSIAEYLKNIFKNATPEESTQDLSAKDLLLQGIRDIDQHSFDDQTAKFELLVVIHQSLYTIAKYEESFTYLDKHFNECQIKLGKKNKICLYFLSEKGKIYSRRRQYDLSLDVYKQAEELAKNNNDKDGLFDLYLSFVTLSRNLQDPKLAEEYLNKAIRLEESNKNPKYQNLYSVLSSKAGLYIHLGRGQEVERILTKLSQLIKQFPKKEQVLLQVSLESLWANYYARIHSMKKGFNHRQKIITMFENNFSLMPKRFGWNLMVTGMAAVRGGQPQIAIELLNKAIKFYQDNFDENQVDIFRMRIEKILVYILIADIQSARSEFELAKQIKEKNPEVLKNYQEKYHIAEAYFNIFNHNKEQLKNEMKKTEKFLQPFFENSTTLQMYWKILLCEYALKINNNKMFKRLLSELTKLDDKFPNDYLSTQARIRQLQDLDSD